MFSLRFAHTLVLKLTDMCLFGIVCGLFFISFFVFHYFVNNNCDEVDMFPDVTTGSSEISNNVLFMYRKTSNNVMRRSPHLPINGRQPYPTVLFRGSTSCPSCIISA